MDIHSESLRKAIWVHKKIINYFYNQGIWTEWKTVLVNYQFSLFGWYYLMSVGYFDDWGVPLGVH